MKKMIEVLLLISTSLGFCIVSLAQMERTEPAVPTAPAIEKQTQRNSEPTQATVLTGTVTAVNAKTGKLTVKVRNREVNLTTDSKATKAALEKLKVGDTVKVFEKGGKVIAASPVKAESKARTTK